MNDAAHTLPASFTLDLEDAYQSKKDTFILGHVPMPDSRGLKAGERNELRVAVRYLKDGRGRQGRGIYLVLTGHTTDGMFERHLLMQDPSLYLLLEPAKRISEKRLSEVAMAVPVMQADLLTEQVARARAYYERK